MSINIAIDGPAGAGKSTIAKKVAKDMGYIYVDTGAMYRTLAIHFIRNDVALNDTEKMSSLCDNVKVDIKYQDNIQHLFLNGEDVTQMLRTEEVGNMASSCAVNPDVRNKLVAIQKEMAKTTDVVMDGRDIGTVVLPDAEVKIFLTASVEVRAERRYKELVEKGLEADIEKIKADIKERDYRDSHREHSPLKQAEDAILVDSSYMSIEQVVNHIEKIIGEKINVCNNNS